MYRLYTHVHAGRSQNTSADIWVSLHVSTDRETDGQSSHRFVDITYLAPLQTGEGPCTSADR